jgi:TM2 domain-containing membrane protein YozV
MDAQKVDMFILTNGKYFEGYEVAELRNQLLYADESKWAVIQTLQFKDPTTSLIVSLVAGSFGVDRFIIGDTGLGIGKLLTCGGLGVWAIIDWFKIMGATREKNMMQLQEALSY